MTFDPDLFRGELSALLDRYETAFDLPAGSHVLLRRQIALGDAVHDRRTFPGHVTTSAIILSPSGSETLLIRHRSLDRWLQPGGHYEPPDSLAASALREALEETGVASLQLDQWHVATGVPVDVDTHRIPARPDRDEPEHWHHDVRYVVRADRSEPLKPDLTEVAGVRWHPIGVLAGFAPGAFLRLQTIGMVRNSRLGAISP
jgi:8-oxo-dGTP pyrophosphatase MutT (NUDIX family)